VGPLETVVASCLETADNSVGFSTNAVVGEGRGKGEAAGGALTRNEGNSEHFGSTQSLYREHILHSNIFE